MKPTEYIDLVLNESDDTIDITAEEAKKLIINKLKEYNIAYKSIHAKLVDPTPKRPKARVFVVVHGAKHDWKNPNPAYTEIEDFAKSKGFTFDI